MEIKERLRLVGDVVEGQTALMIIDEGEEYPVFLEALHNEVYFPLMIESGYILTEYPYGFVKNGKSILDLPIRDYVPTDETLQSMYNSLSHKLPESEIKSHITCPERVLEMPQSNYTIHTREEFIEYLEAIDEVKLEMDFIPINYFVAPEARFTLDEYTSNEFAKYVQIMNRRRTMTLPKFGRLFNWLLSHGLPKNCSAIDVVDAYFAWGLDGLNMVFTDKSRLKSSYTIFSTASTPVSVLRKTVGFIDSAGNALTPVDQRDVQWNWLSPNRAYVEDLAKAVPYGKVHTCIYQTPSSIDIVKLESPTCTIKFSTDTLTMMREHYPTLTIINPVNYASTISLEDALPSNHAKLHEHLVLLAMAKYIVDRRKSNLNASTKSILNLMGMDIANILQYFSLMCEGMSDASITEGGKAGSPLSLATIDAFLSGKDVSDETREVVDDVLYGRLNVGNIAEAKKLESCVNYDDVYRFFYAVHHVFEYSLEDMYEKIRTIQPDQKILTFEHDGLTAELPVSELKYLQNAYNVDLQGYELDAAKDCEIFYMVTKVAREMGNDDCKRHVGFEGYRVIRNSAVDAMLNAIVTKYEDECAYRIQDATVRSEVLKKKYVFSLFAFFEAAMKGRITYPPVLGGNVVHISNEDIYKYRDKVQAVVESTTAYCLRQRDGNSARKFKFHAYCVNAYITPEYVIPRIGQSLNEYSFYALWRDWSDNPSLYEALIEKNVITADFVPWENRYLRDGFSRSMDELANDPDSLYNYFENGIEYIRDFIPGSTWTSVPYPLESMYPGLYDDADDSSEEVDSSATADQAIVRLGLTRRITTDDYAEVVYPQPLLNSESQCIKKFSGYTIEDVISSPDVVRKEPPADKIKFYVYQKSGHICPETSNEAIDFRRLTELDSRYSYMHVYGRKYLIRDVSDLIWEVFI